ncbi:MAG: CoA-binding protein [Erysipelotrichaceae bacterium]|nr:CoA-binding protein [Erysipelotrichaceae bacterium]
MDLKEMMSYHSFAVVGKTLDESKYAYKIKEGLLKHGYQAFGVYSEYPSINAIEEEIDIIVLCINPVLGLKFIQENKKPFKGIIIQPGAESEELLAYLKNEKITFIEGCVLVGLSLYRNKGE